MTKILVFFVFLLVFARDIFEERKRFIIEPQYKSFLAATDR